jgi:hypothetical protein
MPNVLAPDFVKFLGLPPTGWIAGLPISVVVLFFVALYVRDLYLNGAPAWTAWGDALRRRGGGPEHAAPPAEPAAPVQLPEPVPAPDERRDQAA